MRRQSLIRVFVFFAFLSISYTTIQGQASIWSIFSESGVSNATMGLRYIPEFIVGSFPEMNSPIDGLFSLNLNASGTLDNLTSGNGNSNSTLYRGWLRYTSDQSETRIGLQKINFGPAKILRSLQWFDQISPSDPLGLTTGVYSLLSRYYFLDNSNIWAWALYGNTQASGAGTTYAAWPESVEYGGRYQHSLWGGETGLSTHHRLINFKSLAVTERRYSIDGFWDVGLGLWFEAVVVSYTHPTSYIDGASETVLTLGADTTLDGGLTIALENQLINENHKTALSFSYPLDLIYSLNGYTSYDWPNETTTLYIGGQQMLDSTYLTLGGTLINKGTYTSYGLQLMLTMNH